MPLSEEPVILAESAVDLMRVRQLFAVPSRIADSAFLRREVAGRMHERLMMIRAEPERVLDLGCGEGADLPLLHNRFSGAKIVAVDASHAMLSQQNSQGEVAGRICANFAELPFTPGSFDSLWSNLSLHWHPDPLLVFTEWKRVLSQDGMLMFSCFGPETLSLLKTAFGQVDRYGHVLPFMEMHDLGDRMVAAGFASPVLDREVIHVTYETTERLISDIRALGGNALSARRRGLLGKAAYAKLLDYLEHQRDDDGRISLPFEIIYGHAFCTYPERKPRAEAPLHYFSRQ